MENLKFQFHHTVMNAPGFLGFFMPSGYELKIKLDYFVTNPVSYYPRTPASGERLAYFPGGAVVHTGYPNPGYKKVIKEFSRCWARSPVLVIVHLLCEDPGMIYEMVDAFENIEGVAGFELGIPPGCSETQLMSFYRAAQAKLPVIPRIHVSDILLLSNPLVKDEIKQVCVSSPRGLAPLLYPAALEGRMIGPAVFPQVFLAAKVLVSQGFNVVVSGGIWAEKTLKLLFDQGVDGVQLDYFLWI